MVKKFEIPIEITNNQVTIVARCDECGCSTNYPVGHVGEFYEDLIRRSGNYYVDCGNEDCDNTFVLE